MHCIGPFLLPECLELDWYADKANVRRKSEIVQSQLEVDIDSKSKVHVVPIPRTERKHSKHDNEWYVPDFYNLKKLMPTCSGAGSPARQSHSMRWPATASLVKLTNQKKPGPQTRTGPFIFMQQTSSSMQRRHKNSRNRTKSE